MADSTAEDIYKLYKYQSNVYGYKYFFLKPYLLELIAYSRRSVVFGRF